MNTLQVILLVLFFHWIADFVCQTDEMAKNKSKDNLTLIHHVLTYTKIMMLLALCIFQSDLNAVLIFTAVTGIYHYFTDWATSRITSAYWKAGKIHEFFVIVGIDQFLHFAQLFITIKFLGYL